MQEYTSQFVVDHTWLDYSENKGHLKKSSVLSQVFGRHVQAQQVPINAFPVHWIPVIRLVTVAGFPEQFYLLFFGGIVHNGQDPAGRFFRAGSYSFRPAL